MSNVQHTPGLLPCPMCGDTSPWSYAGQAAALLRCQCGLVLSGTEVRTMYKPSEVPLALERYVTAPEVLAKIGYVWVSPTDSFNVFGHTARWNRRAATGSAS